MALQQLPGSNRKINDLTGQRFGKLYVLGHTDERQDRSVVWSCQCDCGATFKVPSRRLLAGLTKSCGCLRADAGLKAIREVAGKQIGSFTVLSMSKRRQHGRIMWICQCICGKTCEVAASNLHSGHIKSCGCLKGVLQRKQSELAGKSYKEITGNYWGHIQASAALRSLEFKVTPKEAWELWERQQGKCALSGQTLTFQGNKRKTQAGTASLDRIDSSKGYLHGNIQWVHKRINVMKSNLSDQDFILLCKLVANHNGGAHDLSK